MAAPNLCLVVGFDAANVPTNLYLGFDISAAQTAAAAANAANTPLVQVFRNLGPAFQEFRPVPTGVRVFNTIPAQIQLASGLAG